MGDIIVIVVLGSIIAWAFIRSRRDLKSNKCAGCSGCSSSKTCTIK